MLRTHFARTSPRHLAGQLRALVANLGYDPDADPDMSTPSEKALRLGAVRSFLARERIAGSMVRLVPALFAAPDGQHFVISDDPVALTNAFAYGDVGLESHGIIVLLPIAPNLAIALVCPTIIARYEAIDYIAIDPERRERLVRYRDGLRSGDPIEIEAAELVGWNERQVASSARRLYGATDDFDFARTKLAEFPERRSVATHVQLGEMGKPPPPRAGMPEGLHLVIIGKADHCILAIADIDRSGEGLTARTTNIALLELVAADTGELRADLYDSGRHRRSISQATVERFGDPTDGWFRVVHSEEGMRSFMRSIDEERAPRA